MFNQNLYKTAYHKNDLSKYSFLVTGGAGFIGSNIVEYLLKNNAGSVKVLDNLSTGYYNNIEKFLKLKNFDFIKGDIRKYETCVESVNKIDYIFHNAALGSVPRSINDPITSNEVNITGFLNILSAAKNSKHLKKMVYAASSSTYGDNKEIPKIEGNEGKPISPYAITKLVNELYAEIFSKVYNFHTIGLRYFNIFGPNQSPNGAYAAVIPLFCKAFHENKRPKIFGDGKTSRDFTFVENAVQANIKAIFANNIKFHKVFNVACGKSFSLNEIIKMLEKISNKNIKPIFLDERSGDIKNSLADISQLKSFCNYDPLISFQDGLNIVFNFYKNEKV